MRKGLMLTSVAGALSMVFGGVALAETHVPPAGGWTVAVDPVGGAGYINFGSACTAGYSCTEVARGAGFLQLQMTPNPTSPGLGSTTLKAGEMFVKTIVTDPAAVGTAGDPEIGFSDVSFIKMSMSQGGNQQQSQNGIYSVQNIKEAKTGLVSGGSETFFSNSTVASGWGIANGVATGAVSVVTIGQKIESLGINKDTQTDDFDAGFSYKGTTSLDANKKEVRTGLALDITQSAGLFQPAADPKLNKGNAGDIQAFALRERSGSENKSAMATPIKLDSAVPGAGVSWTAGQDVKAIWIGQNVDTTTTTGGATGGGAINTPLSSAFGFLSFENLSTPAADPNRMTSVFSIDSTSLLAGKPGTWDVPTFGLAPTICAPDGSTPTCAAKF